MKRRTSARLTARQSPYHSSVTFFEPEPSPPPAKRAKLTPSADPGDPPLAPDDAPDTHPAPTTPTAGPKKTPKKPKPVPQALATPHPAPARWREAYDAIARMRALTPAPVDTMGCDRAQRQESDPKSQRFATLVSLMLSSQTKDEVTDAAVSKLRAALGGSISVAAVRRAPAATLSDAIAKVGFWRRKTQYIKQTAERLHADFDSDVPKTADELCSLPGVGPKMAFLALQVAWNLNLGIGVDVHVHRITNRLGWHAPPTTTPEATRLNLQSWLPAALHPEINRLLVGFGQTICAPVAPRCERCALAPAGLCPSARGSPATRAAAGAGAAGGAPRAGPEIEVAVEVAGGGGRLEDGADAVGGGR